MESFEKYVIDVLDGSTVTNEHVKKAVWRHVSDLIHGDERGLYFDKKEAIWVCNAFPALFKHTSGPLAGQPFHLMPWQAFIVACVFGWKRKDTSLRRFRRVYIEVARRNGKSTLLAAIALFMLLMDGESAAQIYSAATKRDQAKIVWGEARRMVRANSELSEHVETYRESLAVLQTDSTFQPLSSDSKSLDGLNIHGAVVDELHAHPNAEVWQVLDTATGSRAQPLIWIITTAGFQQNASICYEIRGMVIDILNKTVDNDAWFGFVAGLDDKDIYSDESVWEKANPNLPYIETLIPDLREKALRASRSAGEMNNFLVKHMCRWSTHAQSWLKLTDWDKCKAQTPFTYDDMRGRSCFAAFDLAESLDLSAACLCFPPERDGDPYRYMWKFYLPEDTVERYTQEGDFKWRQWVTSGELTATSGPIADGRAIREELNRWATDFDLRICGHDKWHARQLAGQLIDDGIQLVEVPQTFAGISEGAKALEAQIITQQLEHNGGAFLRWQIENAVVISDNHANIKIVKPSRNSKRKIDGILAAVMACGIAVRTPIDTAPTFDGFVFA